MMGIHKWQILGILMNIAGSPNSPVVQKEALEKLCREGDVH